MSFYSTLKLYCALNRRYAIIYNIGTVTQHVVIAQRLRLDRSRRLAIVAPINTGQCKRNPMKHRASRSSLRAKLESWIYCIRTA